MMQLLYSEVVRETSSDTLVQLGRESVGQCKWGKVALLQQWGAQASWWDSEAKWGSAWRQ
jgi:hypothetical protein